MAYGETNTFPLCGENSPWSSDVDRNMRRISLFRLRKDQATGVGGRSAPLTPSPLPWGEGGGLDFIPL